MTDTSPPLAQVLKNLFPSHPGGHILWMPGEPKSPGKKNTRARTGMPSQAAYARHLSVSSCLGPGALGTTPGFPSPAGRTSLTTWAVLDFDDQTPSEVRPFFEALSRQGLTFLFNGGTTGRGTHVWFLLDAPLPLGRAYHSLAFLQRVARYMGAGDMDLRPAAPTLSASGKGDAIFLPYRGAGQDSFGVNPLTDSTTGEEVRLSELPGRPRQSAQAFRQLGFRQSVNRFLNGQPSPPPVERLPRLPSVLHTREDLWQDELERLGGYWRPGRRHHLLTGAVAFGLKCGIPPEQVRQDLLTLMEDERDEELEDRRATIDSNLANAAAGELLAYKKFYGKAGIDAPTLSATPQVQDLVEDLLHRLMSQPWPGKSGKSTRSLLKALLAVAWQHGQRHPEGVEVSVSWAELLERASIGSAATLRRSFIRLEQEGWLRRGAKGREHQSGSLVLTVNNGRNLSRGGEGKGKEYFCSSQAFRYGRGRLGKSAEQMLDLLLYFGPQSFDDLAYRMKARPSDLMRYQSELAAAGVISYETRRLVVQPNFAEALEKRQQEDGSQAAAVRQQALHQAKRQKYRGRLQAKGRSSP